jgi:hypothetical protein
LTDAELPEHECSECMAHHEAGHLVIAAAQKLRLRPEGLSIDQHGLGVAWYCNSPDTSDRSRERILISTLAGFKAQKHFCEENDHPPPFVGDGYALPNSCDLQEVWRILQSLKDDGNHVLLSPLVNETERLIEQHWPAIEGLAAALLGKEWELLRPLKSGDPWWHKQSTSAKYVEGEEVVSILSQYGILAICVSDCLKSS